MATHQQSTIQRLFVSLTSETSRQNPAGFMPCQGVLHLPENGEVDTAFIAAHYNVDFKEHYLGPLLAEKGFGFLGFNTRYAGAEPWFLLDHALVDLGAGIRYLRERCGFKRIVLLGNSGGGSLMAAYQSQAVDVDIQPVAGMALAKSLDQLQPGDLYVSLNAHLGRPEVLTSWMDPSVIDENDPLSVDESLNMYNPENGPPYSKEFVDKYRDAQAARNRRITDWVVGEIRRLEKRGVSERLFTMARTWADLRLMDATLDPSDRPIGVCYIGDARRANFDGRGIGGSSSLRSWLSMWSLDHSCCRGEPHMNKIEVPSLVIQSLADTGVFPSDAKAIYAAIGAEDKTLELVAGDHYLTSPDAARAKVTQLITDWVLQRVP